MTTLKVLTRRLLIDAGGFAVVLAALGWAYAPTVSLPLWGDDAWHVFELRDPARALRMLYDPGIALSVSMFWFRPVGDLSYTLDHRLWGLNPAGYHLHGLALHALVVLVLVGLIREWFHLRASDPPPGPASVWLIALAFTLNPITALTLARPSMRYDLYATLFVLAALLAFCRWQRGVWPSGRTAALCAAIAAFASKESAVVLLPILFLVGDGGPARRLRAIWPFAAAFCLYVGWRLVAIEGLGGYPWVSWSWEAFLHPDRYAAAAVTMAREGWGTAWVLLALLVDLPRHPRRAGIAILALLSALAPLTLFPRLDAVVPLLHYFYLPLALFSLSLATACAVVERWRPGRVIVALGLLCLTWRGFTGSRPLLDREVRTGQEATRIVSGLAHLGHAPANLTHYFLFDGSGLAEVMALATTTRPEAWNILHPAAARVSPGLAAKARAGTARIFSLDGTAWKDTTRETAEAIRTGLEAPREPAPPVALTADGYRLHVRVPPGTTGPRPSLRMYYGPVGDPDVYRGVLPIAGPEATFAVPPGAYAVTATLIAPDGRESAPTSPARLVIPARRQSAAAPRRRARGRSPSSRPGFGATGAG